MPVWCDAVAVTVATTTLWLAFLSNRGSAQISELATRGKVTSESGEQRDLTTKELREISRQMYLPKRAEKELKLLEAQLQDEESLFLNEGEL